ncbi:hypothetical protein [Flaviaesturariibacter flavus]|uniref:hypothetical protein n=1 Tax=Flaviaesturariibacter flavus TaxID=2502780 RepID=UPI001404A1B4|nr:hypothetical protein [Flaviaesturariibacter flavus]
MKNVTRIAVLIALVGFTASCSVFKKNKEGCPSDGRNVGAEKLLSEPPKKTPKYRVQQ